MRASSCATRLYPTFPRVRSGAYTPQNVRPLLITLCLAAGCSTCMEDPYIQPNKTVIGGVVPINRDGGASSSSDAGSGDGGVCRATCSADQLSVIDCARVSRACAPGDGCIDGQCVPGCAAARQAQSTVGCEFYVAGVPPELATRGSCHALYIANVWNAPVHPTLRRGSSAVSTDVIRLPKRGSDGTMRYERLPTVAGKSAIPPGQLAIAFLAEAVYSKPPEYFVACPVQPATSDFQYADSHVSDAFQLVTDVPVIATDIYPYGGADSHVTSAALLLPVTAWGTQHFAVTPADQLIEDFPPEFPNFALNPYVQLISNDDDTEIALTPSVTVEGVAGVFPYTQARMTTRFRLRAGKVLQLSPGEQLTGSTIVSTRPIAVLAGHPCQNKPGNVTACDSMHLQLLATSLYSSRAVGVRYPSRVPGEDEETLWRIIAAADGTRLTWSPAQPDGGPSTLNKAQSVEFSAAGPFVVESQDAQHPLLLTEFMTGGTGHLGRGDPEWVPVVAPEQWLARYVFFTDPTYSQTSLVFTREEGPGGAFEPVTLDCGPALQWQPIAGTPFEYAVLSWARADQSACADGVHTASSKAPFGLTVWGTEHYTSYGFPAGMGVRPLNTVSIE